MSQLGDLPTNKVNEDDGYHFSSWQALQGNKI